MCIILINIPVRGRNLVKSFNVLLLIYKIIYFFKFQCSIPIGRYMYLSSCVKSTVDIHFRTLFTDMHMKTRNFSRI